MFKIKSTFNSLNNKYQIFKSNTLKYNNSNSQENQVNIKLQSHLIKTHSGNVIENQQKVDNIKIKKEEVQIKTEYKAGLLWAKYNKDDIFNLSKIHIQESIKRQSFDDNDIEVLDSISENCIKLIDHPILYKNKDELSIEFITKTSNPNPYIYYNDNLEIGGSVPFKLGKEIKGVQYYSSVERYEIPKKSPLNGEVLIEMNNYKHLMDKFNITEDYINNIWGPYFIDLKLTQKDIVMMHNYIKADYTVKPFMLNILKNKLLKGELSIDYYIKYESEIMKLQPYKIDKDNILNKLQLKEANFLKLKLE